MKNRRTMIASAVGFLGAALASTVTSAGLFRRRRACPPPANCCPPAPARATGYGSIVLHELTCSDVGSEHQPQILTGSAYVSCLGERAYLAGVETPEDIEVTVDGHPVGVMGIDVDDTTGEFSIMLDEQGIPASHGSATSRVRLRLVGATWKLQYTPDRTEQDVTHTT